MSRAPPGSVVIAKAPNCGQESGVQGAGTRLQAIPQDDRGQLESQVSPTDFAEEPYKISPPTALIVGDPTLFLAVKNYFASRRGKQLRQVALISMDHDPCFDWCKPMVAHFNWDKAVIVRGVVRWAGNLACGKEDKRQVIATAKLSGGETLPEA